MLATLEPIVREVVCHGFVAVQVLPAVPVQVLTVQVLQVVCFQVVCLLSLFDRNDYSCPKSRSALRA